MRTPRGRIASCFCRNNSTAPIAVTDVPLFVTAGWFRLAADRYYVPISVAVPGASIPRANDKTTLDIAGFIRDERGAPVGRIRDTLTVPPASADTLAARQVLYQTGVTLPPGRFQVKVVVRENVSGQMGTFEAAILVPELKQSAGEGQLAGAQHAAAERLGPPKPEPARARWTRARPEPHAHCESQSEGLLLLRGVRARRPTPVHRSCARACRSIAGR